LRTYFLCTKVSISNELTSKVSNICTCLRMKCQAKHMLALCTYCFLRCHHWNQNAPDFQVHGAETKEARCKPSKVTVSAVRDATKGVYTQGKIQNWT